MRAFDPSVVPAGLGISADYAFTAGGLLHLRYEIQDPAGLLADAPVNRDFHSSDLVRADGLWQSTCFEAFFAAAGSNAYYEINIAFDGRWNLYRFDDYRSPQPPRSSDDFSMTELKTVPGRLDATLMSKLPVQTWETSLCAVLKTRAGETFYFSTHHAGPKPDFHRRDSLILGRRA